jgi:lysophospholipase
MNLWLLLNLSDGQQGNFAKRSLAELDDEVTFSKFAHRLSKRWPADEQALEANRTVAGVSSLLPLIGLMQEYFNTTLFQTLYAVWPNPFLNASTEMTNYPDLLMVDGSEGGQTIPILPIIQPARHVDFLIANDASGTELSNGWMNGSNLIDSAAYAHANGIPFPNVPDQATFINYNFTVFPTFFGCNDSLDVPLVLYAADAPWSAYTNETFLSSEYNAQQINTVLNNTFNLYSFGNNTVDTEWSGCIACAVMLRSLQRMNMTVPEFCTGCWQRHCWNGTYNSTLPNDFFEPRTVLNASLTYAEFINSPFGANSSASATTGGNSSTNSTSSSSAAGSGTNASGTSSGASSSSSTESSASQLGSNIANFTVLIAISAAVILLSN